MTRRMRFDFKKAGWSTNYLEFKKMIYLAIKYYIVKKNSKYLRFQI